MLKAVIDTNVFVSAYLKSMGLCARVIDLWIAGIFQLAVSGPILDEYEEVLLRKGISTQLIEDLNRAILKSAVFTAPSRSINLIKIDPEDNKFLECAVCSRADYIVSGDSHLRKLGIYGDVRIISPRDFIRILE
ncbi:putative toxin-antitoxin system toxin component, PIN family [Candidatus Desantisbacteria bacterium CG1_02_49_89]|nr:MAG: putative toxin-antitoxin system toxin component, PIN family [Candidatus Desantisbacteria bacterium CG1_02_49_89]PJB27319.1 MAG: putative toxin-antitoxin system toxin component, PIN family [Candidatus Desantisbacteria bacterium CG_4_9_14_3_um_filter_50_7]